MYTNTDLVIYILCIWAVYRGWKKGLIHSLITPASFCVAGMISLLYYDSSKNLIKALIFVTIGGPGLAIFLKSLLYLGRRSLSEEDRKYVYWGSRVLGIIANLSWQVLLITFFLIILTTAPDKFSYIKDIKKDIFKSQTYGYINTSLIERIPILYSVQETFRTYSDPVELAYIKDLPEYKSIVDNPSYQKLLLDTETMEQMESGDYLGLMRNPLVLDLLENDRLMRSISSLNEKIFKEKSTYFSQIERDYIRMDEDDIVDDSALGNEEDGMIGDPEMGNGDEMLDKDPELIIIDQRYKYEDNRAPRSKYNKNPKGSGY